MSPVAPPSSGNVIWFGASSRIVGGQPDSRYGWIGHPGGPCVVKELDRGLAIYAGTLLQHERDALHRLVEVGAPAPELVDFGRPTWVVTRFAGLSMANLLRIGAEAGIVGCVTVFPWIEQLSAWAHLLRRLQPMARENLLMIDLHIGNIVVPMTDVIKGQLRLNRAGTIDHAHTLAPGMNLRRPVLIDAREARVAPELREALNTDLEAFKVACGDADVDRPYDSISRLPDERVRRARRFWAEYDEPQRVQKLLDSNRLSADAAMQYAIGTALSRLSPCAAERPVPPGVEAVIRRMCSQEPSARFNSLGAAADGLTEVAGTPLPVVGHHRFQPNLPDDLSVTTRSKPVSISRAAPRSDAHVGDDGTVLRGDAVVAPAFVSNADHPTRPTPDRTVAGVTDRRHYFVRLWLTTAAAAVGAFVAVLSPW